MQAESAEPAASARIRALNLARYSAAPTISFNEASSTTPTR